MCGFGKSWIGVDAETCADTCGASPCAATQLSRVRPDGARVAMALPMDVVFFEKMELPGMDWKVAEGLLPGKFDLKIPVPIEKCLLYTVPVRGAGEPLFLVFAVTKESYEARLRSFRAATGLDPEAVFPAAAALAEGCVRHLGGGKPNALLLHAAADQWTLIAVADGLLSGVVTVEAGDIDSARRNAKILAMRFASPPQRLLVSGPGAEEGLADRLNESAKALPWRAEAVPEPTTFLAAGLARLAASRDGRNGFRERDERHPATRLRKLRACLLLGFTPLVLSAAAFAVAVHQYVRSADRLAQWNGALDRAAARVANGPLPQHGRAAVERAKGLFDWRNPAIAAFAEGSPLDVLPALFEAAAARGMTFSSLSFADGVLQIAGQGAVEADVGVLRQAAEKAGYALAAEISERGDGIGFSATVSRREGGAQ